jgi:hypothetical protein
MREDKYKVAIETHKHYDTLSITVIAGMFAITFACYSLHKDLRGIINTNYIFFVGAAANLVFYFMYHKLSTFALIARNVSRMLELKDGMGVSEVYFLSTQKDQKSVSLFAPYAVKHLSGVAFSIRFFVFLIALGQSLALVITGIT